MNDGNADQLELTADIVAAYVQKNSIPMRELPDLIGSISDTLAKLSQQQNAHAEPPVELKPAVPIKKSVTPDFIISLEDGRKFKSMKRYLSLLGMTPDEYRTKWGLPRDYPMVAPNYAAQRSALAKSLGLGRKPKQAEAAPDPEPTPQVEVAAPEQPKKRGRKKAAEQA